MRPDTQNSVITLFFVPYKTVSRHIEGIVTQLLAIKCFHLRCSINRTGYWHEGECCSWLVESLASYMARTEFDLGQQAGVCDWASTLLTMKQIRLLGGGIHLVTQRMFMETNDLRSLLSAMHASTFRHVSGTTSDEVKLICNFTYYFTNSYCPRALIYLIWGHT